MTLFPELIGPVRTCRTALIFALVANTKMCSIFLEKIRNSFLRVSIEFLGLELEFRVGRVSGNTTIFCTALVFSLCRQKVTRTIDTGAGFFLEEEDDDEDKSKKTEVKHPLGKVKVILRPNIHKAS
jgi:hypothetical protein